MADIRNWKVRCPALRAELLQPGTFQAVRLVGLDITFLGRGGHLAGACV